MTVDVAKETGRGEYATAEGKTLRKVGIPKEISTGERRVAATPDTAKVLQKLGFEVLIESKAGETANFPDDLYRQAGCQIVPDAETLWAQTDIVLKVRPPDMHPTLGKHEVDLLSFGGHLIGFIWPSQNPELLERLAARKATVLAMDAIPRITRAQKMDALSSMANIAGYRAVIEAANHFDRFFTGQITAAGKVPPAKVLVIGAGVAGLAAIGTARGLGAVVRAFDTRPAVKEQVQSLGAEFLELKFAEDGTGEGGYAKVMSDEFIKAEMALFATQAREVDIIITTALIPGQKAPLLITQAMVESMKKGSVIVDMAAEQGGNCAVTKPSEVYRYQEVTIVGLTDLPSRMAYQASQLYGTNLCHLLEEMGGASEYKIDLENEVVRGALVLHNGEVTWPPPKPEKKAGGTGKEQQQESVKKEDLSPKPSLASPTSPPLSSSKRSNDLLWLFLAGLALVGVGLGAPSSFLSHFTVFILACFIGWQVIWNVKPALHTPLMSVTNAISGIIIIGGMLQISGAPSSPTTILGAIAVLIGTINISGGFLVTQRMLKMFQK
ncbi:MAG: Re/Si-specific NAD(P)(+) transhydrogenase subunit alpha [Chroococcidiopsidaceae cyanobacterium CP_BM_ER_R8_30]|nr:Re/Si-specific NAD(P)(+) transhydrogenase subunit alpha [Chroococcidiopsidaceae cyanobacterium CP_BM_ER_R8_30]